ncbi:MAG TPA: DNA ligase D [Thermoanaerobaculia bacterium]|nr:DNA ligase D [Thermoanaerobaculia bacterium]
MKPKQETEKENGPAALVRKALARMGAPRADVDPAAVRAMKPETSDRPFSRAGWVFELKYDGFRVLAAGGAGEARLFYKSGHDATRIFPELAQAVAALPFQGLILDGEAVVLDETGKPNFQRLQRRGLRTKAIDAAHAAATSPATLFVFDLLACEGFDLRSLPLSARKEMLRRVFAAGGEDGWIRLSEEVPERGEDLYAAVSEMGLEGIVAKRSDSPYRAGYSPDWLKIRVDCSSDFAVVGFEPIPRSRSGFRNLHVAFRGQGGELVYAGTVGTGFSSEEMDEIRARLEPARRETPPLPVPAIRGAIWVEPELVVELRYKEWTEGGHLRHPVFLRVRDDKTVDECFRPGEEQEAEEEEEVQPAAASPALTNLDKVFWPDEGITKGNLIDFYRTVAPWMLPYLKDRVVMLDRYPNGITGKSFIQKSLKDTDPIVCDSVETLLYLVNLGAIPFHVESSRVTSPERPDWCILDLDPKTAPFSHVVEIALAIRELCEEIELEGLIKTSGGSGLHILLPMGGLFSHEQAKQLAELLAQLIVKQLPAIATTARSIAARQGRVYVDALQNGRGKMLAAPYAVRPLPGAPASTPLEWREVNDRLDVRAFNLKTIPGRLRKLKEDPLLPVLSRRPDLARTLELLSEKF